MATIIWSNQAEQDYYDNVDYLMECWGLASTRSFIDKVDSTIAILEKGNVTFKPTNCKGIYEVVIVKQISLFYRTNDGAIELVRFWNNYQNPNRNKL
jgi:plasmid stabilization system protein ParE